MKRTLAASLLALAASLSHAAYSAEAVNNATIQITGPRSGGNGKNFLNIEGSGVAEQFRSWGIADFTAASFNIGFTVGDVSNFKIVLTEANASFTAPGVINFYLTTDTTNSIEPGTSPFVWQNNVLPEGVGNQLPTEYLGTGQFTTTGNVNSGQVDTYTVTLSPTAEAILVNALNSNGTIRLVVTPDSVAGSPLVAATFAGFSNNTYVGPVLEFDAAPSGTTETLAPVAQAVNLGRITAGDLASLAADDNNAQVMCKFFVVNQSSPFINTQLAFNTTIAAPTALEFKVKAKWNNAGSYAIRLLQYNYVTNSDVQTLAETSLSSGFSVHTGTATGTLSDFVSAGETKARIHIRQTGPSTALLPCASFEFAQQVVTG